MVIAMVMLANTMVITLQRLPGKPQRGGPRLHDDDNDDTDGDDGEEHGADSESHLNLFKVSRNGVALSSTVKAISLSGCSRLTDRGLALVARRCHLLQV